MCIWRHQAFALPPVIVSLGGGLKKLAWSAWPCTMALTTYGAGLVHDPDSQELKVGRCRLNRSC